MPSALCLALQAAMAATAGTSPSNVEIVGVNEVRRRAGSINVETKVVYLLISVGRGREGGNIILWNIFL